MQFVFVAIGGFFGAMARYGTGLLFATGSTFPFGTLTANLLGCLFLGWFSAFTAGKSANPRLVLLIGTGFTGSFTTFSTFSLETFEMFQNGNTLLAFSYIGVSIVAGLLLVLLGIRVARTMLKSKAV